MAEEASSSKAAGEAPALTVIHNYTVNAGVYSRSGQVTFNAADSQMNMGGSHVTELRDSESVEVVLPSKSIKRQNSSETPISSKKAEKAASYPGERLEDVFQDEIIKALVDITSFKRFARSSKGLCLDDHILQQIIEDHAGNVEEQKIRMLNKWRKITGEKATVSKIRYLLRRYLRGDNKGDYIVLENGRYGIYKNHVLCKRAHVFLGEQTSEVTGSYICAIKLHQYNEKNLREAKILSKLRNHVNVVSVLYAGIHHGDPHDYIFIAMDLSWTDTVRNMLEDSDQRGIPFNEFISMNLVGQILRALDFIHSNNIIHRDLKPENILLSKDWSQSKVTDFGLSKTITEGHLTKQTNVNIGTEGYRAPETYITNAMISLKSDIFSTGVTIAEISSNGKHPFGGEPLLWSYNIKINKNLDLSHLLVPQIRNLIKRMLEMDPEKRPTAEEVLKEVQQYQTSSQPKNQQTKADQSSATSSMTQLQPPTAEKVQQYQTSVQPKNQQTTDDQSSAPSSMTQLQRQTAEPGLNEVQQYQTSSQPKNQQTTAAISSAASSMTQRSTTEKANAIIMFNRTDRHMYSYKPSTKEWSQMQKFASVRSSFFTTVVSGKHIYILREDRVYQLEYSDSTAKWKQVSSMSEYHGDQPPAAVLNGSIYVCGRSGFDVTNSVERYDEDSDRWHHVCDMNNERQYFCVVATKDQIYCMGGDDERMDDLKSVERFDAKLNKWEFVTSLPRSISNDASAAVVKNRIYVAHNKGVLCYNIQNDSWTDSWREIKLSDQWPFKLPILKFLAVNEELYLVGNCVKAGEKKKKTIMQRILRKTEYSPDTKIQGIYLLEPETGQMTLVEEFGDKSDYNVKSSLAVKL